MIKIVPLHLVFNVTDDYISFAKNNDIIIIWKKDVLEISNYNSKKCKRGNFVTLKNGDIIELNDKNFEIVLSWFCSKRIITRKKKE